MNTRTERINWTAMSLIGDLQMIPPEQAFRHVVEVLNGTVDTELAEMRSVLEQCLRRLEKLNTGGPSEPDPTVVRIRAVLAKGKA